MSRLGKRSLSQCSAVHPGEEKGEERKEASYMERDLSRAWIMLPATPGSASNPFAFLIALIWASAASGVSGRAMTVAFSYA